LLEENRSSSAAQTEMQNTSHQFDPLDQISCFVYQVLMTSALRIFSITVFAMASLSLGACSTYSGPGSSIKKGAVYEAQDNAFRRMAR